ncbi:unnamed protein product [Rhodiola kirilowii]
MGKKGFIVGILVLMMVMRGSFSSLSPTGINFEVVALMAIKNSLVDPHNVLESWDINSVDPCSWRMVTCASDGFVSSLELPSQSLSGTLSSGIGNLSNLENVLLQSNSISGPIPSSIGKLEKLQALDLSHNLFSGGIPDTLGNLKNLNYLRLNNNSLTGPIPESLSQIIGLTLVDLSFNNFSGSLPNITARTFKIIGNPLLCGLNSSNNCSASPPEPLILPPDSLGGSTSKSHHVAIAIGASSGGILLVVVLGFLAWRYRHSKQVFFDVNDQYDPEICFGHLKRYSFKELRNATDHFNSKNILGKGGFGVVYKGILNNGKIVAVKRLNDYNAIGGEIQFQTEVELISLAVHRNLLRLCGFCSTENERLLVYPYMPNGSVASRLKDCTRGQPALDWSRRKMIALGTARGLLYLHEQCDPKIIHRDVKAANILLDEDFEAVVGDFGLAKLLDHRESHVTTAVRGTVNPPKKTDVFGFGILLLELITGCKALDIGKGANQKGVTLDWVKKLHKEGKLSQVVDKDLRQNYDHIELEEIIQVALLCTQFNPSHRPKMSEVLKMLEGDGLAEKWEASQKTNTPRLISFEKTPQRYSDYIDESSLVVEAMELSGPR